MRKITVFRTADGSPGELSSFSMKVIPTVQDEKRWGTAGRWIGFEKEHREKGKNDGIRQG